jgi:hypothetical protein
MVAFHYYKWFDKLKKGFIFHFSDSTSFYLEEKCLLGLLYLSGNPSSSLSAPHDQQFRMDQPAEVKLNQKSQDLQGEGLKDFQG